MDRQLSRLFLMLVGAVSTISLMERAAKAEVVYQSTALENNFIPFGEDGTPGRPVPGDKLGNTITLAGRDDDDRVLDRITVLIAVNNSAGTPDPTTDTWTLELYRNDGPRDPESGLRQPRSRIASASTEVTMPPFNQVSAVFDFGRSRVELPSTFTVVISSTHPTDTYFGTQGVAGPYSSAAPPTIGSGIDTVWYDVTEVPWATNSTWAIDDGATTNYFEMTVEVVSRHCEDHRGDDCDEHHHGD